MNDRVETADCVIVGGGLMGMLSARLLAAEGLAVILLEQGRLCRESSWAGGGIISPLGPWTYPDAVNQLVHWSQPRYPQLAEALRQESGIDPEWTQSGMLLLDQALDDDVRAWHARFPCELEALSADALPSLEPGMLQGQAAALWMPQIAQIRNPRLGKALARALELQGVIIREHSQVNGIDTRAGKVRAVQTVDGKFIADRVVIASGAWSGQLQIPGCTAAPVEPVLGQMIMFAAAPGLLRHILIREGHYLIPRRDGLVLAGSTLEHTGFSKHETPGARRELAAFARDLVPALADCPVAGHWSGLRPGGTPGEVPLIGEVPGVTGLYLNAGHFRNGVGMAPASARLLADLVLDRDPIVPPGPYDPALALA